MKTTKAMLVETLAEAAESAHRDSCGRTIAFRFDECSFWKCMKRAEVLEGAGWKRKGEEYK